MLATDVAIAQAPAATAAAAQSDGDVSAWLLRLNEASRNRAYTGTFVVSAGSVMSSARIWHVCDG
ncbi:MAG: sigma-E factor regulatory protein RseB domain-containing protein, partial [Burkholderiaceae bacterium]|nr:sigma-E factor regulatory protein RseB domain-containing protein [Burkholderiaceae bacterium]